MKKFLPLTLAAVTLGLAAALIVPNPTQAAPGAHPAKASGARMQKMADTLGLSDAQKAQIKPILMNTARQASAIRANTSLTPQARQGKMKDLRKSMNQQVMAILTPAQRQKMKAMRQPQGAKGG